MENKITCARCKQAKAKECFHVRKSSKTGRGSWCCLCKQKYDVTYRKANKKLHAAQHRAWWYKKRIKEMENGIS